MKRRWAALALAAFMLGFPGLGLWFFWTDAHNRISRSAEPAAQAAIQDVLKAPTSQALDDRGTLELRQSSAEQNLAKERQALGAFKGLGPLRPVDSWAGTRGDMAWQFATFTAEATFERGAARVDLTMARRTMNPEWRIDAFRLTPR